MRDLTYSDSFSTSNVKGDLMDAASPIQPWAEAGNMKVAAWPWAWGSEPNKKVYRREGKILRALDPVGYAKLYEDAGITPDPGTGPSEDPGTGGDGGTDGNETP